MGQFKVIKTSLLINGEIGTDRLVLTSPDIAANMRFVNTNKRIFRRFKTYNLDYMYQLTIFGTNLKKRINVRKISRDILKSSHITKVNKDITNIKDGAPIIYDAYFYNKLFFAAMNDIKGARLLTEDNSCENTVLSEYHDAHDEYNSLLFENYVGKRAIKEYVPFVKNLVSKISSNTKPLVVIDMEYWGDSFISMSKLSQANASTPASIIYNLLHSYVSDFKSIECDFLFFNGEYAFRISPSECDESSYSDFRQSIKYMRRVSDSKTVPATSNDTVSSIIDADSKDDIIFKLQDKIGNDIGSNRKNFVGDMEDVDTKVEELANRTIQNMKNIDSKSDEEISKEISDEIDKSTDILVTINRMRVESSTGPSDHASNIRNKELFDKQSAVKINDSGLTLDKILETKSDVPIVPRKIKSNCANTDMTENSFIDFAKTYNENLLDRDTLNIINFFKSRRDPIYVLDIQKTDTSDEFDHKFTYRVKMETAGRKRYTLEFDMPKFLDDRYLYLGGNKKSIIHQFMLKPISKTGPDTVQLVSDYNKVFIYRTGTKLSAKMEKIKKCINLKKGNTSASKMWHVVGNSLAVNAKFKTTIEYDEFSNYYMSIKFGACDIIFNQELVDEFLSKKKIKFTRENENLLPVGQNNGTVLYLNNETNCIVNGKVDMGVPLSDYMIDVATIADPSFRDDIKSTTVGKKFITTVAVIMETKVPTILVTCYMEGITKVLKKAGVNYEFSDVRPKNINLNDKVVRFEDGYIICRNVTIAQDMFLNGLSHIPTEIYKFSEFDMKETYLNIFDELYGKRKILGAFENFYDLFVSPITLEILQQLNLPEDFVSLMIMGNELLADSQFESDTSLSHYRIRSNEIVNAHLYKVLATSYSKYRGSLANKTPKPFTIPKDAVLKDIVSGRSIEDTSSLSVAGEAESMRSVSFKGVSGMNQERAYTIDKRSYSNTYRGVVGMSSAPSGSVGIVKHLGFDANIISARGYMDTSGELSKTGHLNSANQFTASELLTTGSAQHDDPPRVSMQFAQTGHMVPCANYSKQLLSNGSDEVLGSVSSNEYAYKAKKKGVVVEVDEKNEFIKVEYVDGSRDVISIGANMAKNSGGGFYIDNMCSIMPKVKAGFKFDANDILTYNPNFFSPEPDNTVSYRAGTIHKFAIMANANNFEDSGLITTKFADKLQTKIIAKKEVVLGKNSNIDFIANVGDSVVVGDSLLVFDESFEDEGVNEMLASLGSNLDEVLDISKQKIKTKYTGVIREIRCYYANDVSEFSQSAQLAIKKVTKVYKDKKRSVAKHTDIKNTNLILPPTDPVTTKYGKVKGVEINDGIMFEFYIEYTNRVGIADKLVNFNALKCTIGKIIEPGLEPYSEFRPDEEISNMISPVSYWARMTDAIIYQMATNKYLIEAGRQLADIITKF